MPAFSYDHALGLVSRRFQELELYLSIFAWGLMAKDQRVGHAVTSQLSFSRLLILVSTLLKARTRKRRILDRFGLFAKRAAEAEQKRNRVIHSAYLQISNDPKAKLIRYKVTSRLERGLVYHWEALGYEAIMDIAVELTQSVDYLIHFIKQHQTELGIDFSGVKPEPVSDEDVPF